MSRIPVAEGRPICNHSPDAPVKKHLECARCTILIGPGHHEVEGKIVNGRLLCSSCQKLARVRPTPFREALKSWDGLFEFWKSGATKEDVQGATGIIAGTHKCRMRRRIV